MWISKWKKLYNGDNQYREDNSSLAGGTTFKKQNNINP